MVKTNLRKLLDAHGITPYRFAQAVKAKGKRTQSWAYRTVRGEFGLTTEAVELILETLRELTGKPISVGDLLEYAEPTGPSTSTELSRSEDAEKEAWLVLFEAAPPPPHEVVVLTPPPEEAGHTYRADDTHKEPRRSLQPLFTGLLGLVLLALGFGLGIGSQRLVALVTVSAGAPVVSEPVTDEVVTDEPVPTPVAIGPEGETSSVTPKLRVNPVPGATNYIYSVFNLESRQNVLYENSAEPFYIVPENALCPGARYGWKVKAFRGGRESSFSSNTEFLIRSDDPAHAEYAVQRQQPDIPVTVGPVGTVTTLPGVLEVEPVKSAYGYGFYLRDLELDRVYDFEYQSRTPAFTLPERVLRDGGRYRWNARAYNCAGFSLGYSNTAEFEVALRGGEQ